MMLKIVSIESSLSFMSNNAFKFLINLGVKELLVEILLFNLNSNV